MKFVETPADVQRSTITKVQHECGMAEQSIEKDWWVSAVLRALFALPYSGAMSFKGGTSLSKCWHLIDRFSEDVDIAVDREFLGYGGELSRTQVSDKLRRAACSFVRERLQFDLRNKMVEQGIPKDKFKVVVRITPVTTVDPEIVSVEYDSAFQSLPYVSHSVKIEVSGRSMSEPLEDVGIRSIIEDVLPDAPFSEGKFIVPTVKPERTFLEKICLLHEEFHKDDDEVRILRMSRHLYDIVMIMKSPAAERALADRELFASVVEHRRKFIGLRGFDYSTLCAKKISIVPPESIAGKWKDDYMTMCESMMYGDYPSFDDLLAAIRRLQDRLKTCL